MVKKTVNSKEGIGNPYITVNNGTVSITATDDGLNATNGGKTNDGSLIKITGGNVYKTFTITSKVTNVTF